MPQVTLSHITRIFSKLYMNRKTISQISELGNFFEGEKGAVEVVCPFKFTKNRKTIRIRRAAKITLHMRRF